MRFNRGLVLDARRLVYHSNQDWRVIKKKKVDLAAVVVEGHEHVGGGGLLPDAIALVVAKVHLRLQGAGFRVQGSGFRVQGSGFRVQDWVMGV